MLKALANARLILPSLLTSRDGWNTKLINYQTPTVERLWRNMPGYRLYLHRIHTFEGGTAFMHPHLWPCGIYLEDGVQEMLTGKIIDGKIVQSGFVQLLTASHQYAMTDPDDTHSVRPVGGPSLSIMVTGPLYPNLGAKSTGAHPDLPEVLAENLFETFQARYPLLETRHPIERIEY